jgi:hypothetical protein
MRVLERLSMSFYSSALDDLDSCVQYVNLMLAVNVAGIGIEV